MPKETKRTFKIPQREDVTTGNRAIFDRLQENIDQVPNLYKAIAYSRDALNGYLNFKYNITTLNAREKQAIILIVSQLNTCAYSLSAYSEIGKLFDFTPEQLDELRHGSASYEQKLKALAGLVKDIALNKGNVSPEIWIYFLSPDIMKSTW